jgi:hypothetical protein
MLLSSTPSESTYNPKEQEVEEDLLAMMDPMEDVTIRPQCHIISNSGSVFSHWSGWYH